MNSELCIANISNYNRILMASYRVGFLRPYTFSKRIKLVLQETLNAGKLLFTCKLFAHDTTGLL